MSAQIQSIAEWMSVVIRLTGPCIRPDVAYVQASGMSPIQLQEANGNDSMREFQIQSGPIVEMGAFIGPCYEQWREMDVVMRYVFDERQGDEWREVDRMAADDFDRINLALPRPPLEAPWSSAGVWNIQFSKHDKLAKSPRIKGVWEQTLTFRVLYSVTDLVQDWTYVVGYNTLTALKTALSGRPDGTTARLTNARTSELIGTWQKEAGGIKACPPVNFAKADGTEFADGVDIISQGAGTWSITYGTGIVVADAAAEFYGYAEEANSDILPVGTRVSYGRQGVLSYTSLGELETIDGSTDEIRRLLDGLGAFSADYRWDNVSAWDALTTGGGGGGLVTEHTTLASLYAEVGASRDRALLKTSADVEVGVWLHDGTRWVLNGKCDLVAAGLEGAAMFAGYLSVLGGTIAWSAVEGPTVTLTTINARMLLQTMSTPMTWYTDLQRIQVAENGEWVTAFTGTRSHQVGAFWGVAGAPTCFAMVGGQHTAAGNMRTLSYFGEWGGGVSSATGANTPVNPAIAMRTYMTFGARSVGGTGAGGFDPPPTDSGVVPLVISPAESSVQMSGNAVSDTLIYSEGAIGDAYRVDNFSLVAE